MMRVIQGNTELFNDVRLIVSEGIYRAELTETLSGDCEKKNKGQLIYYQVINQEGTLILKQHLRLQNTGKTIQLTKKLYWTMILTTQTGL